MERIDAPDERVLGLRRDDMITLVFGSTWPADEDMIVRALQQCSDARLRAIIVPHEPTEAHIARIEGSMSVTRASRITDASTTEHIVVDAMGALVSYYAIADAAYVGGGFGVGVHSLAEPAGLGCCLACGPTVHRSRDAAALSRVDALRVTNSVEALVQWIREDVMVPARRRERGERCRQYITTHCGSSDAYAAQITASIRPIR
jgi:3-deoxy-D-manno-octulosonic-acid transferase